MAIEDRDNVLRILKHPNMGFVFRQSWDDPKRTGFLQVALRADNVRLKF